MTPSLPSPGTPAAPPENLVVWANGHLTDPEEGALSAVDHGITVGDGVFETCAVFDGHAFARDIPGGQDVGILCLEKLVHYYAVVGLQTRALRQFRNGLHSDPGNQQIETRGFARCQSR